MVDPSKFVRIRVDFSVDRISSLQLEICPRKFTSQQGFGWTDHFLLSANEAFALAISSGNVLAIAKIPQVFAPFEQGKFHLREFHECGWWDRLRQRDLRTALEVKIHRLVSRTTGLFSPRLNSRGRGELCKGRREMKRLAREGSQRAVVIAPVIQRRVWGLLFQQEFLWVREGIAGRWNVRELRQDLRTWRETRKRRPRLLPVFVRPRRRVTLDMFVTVDRVGHRKHQQNLVYHFSGAEKRSK